MWGEEIDLWKLLLFIYHLNGFIMLNDMKYCINMRSFLRHKQLRESKCFEESNLNLLSFKRFGVKLADLAKI